jgi:hypothetical protein
MRFQIEQRHLTDQNGRPIPFNDVSLVSFHLFEASDADQAIRLFIHRDGAALVGEILRFPGFQAVATVRKATGVYTLQVGPTSQSMTAIDD